MSWFKKARDKIELMSSQEESEFILKILNLIGKEDLYRVRTEAIQNMSCTRLSKEVGKILGGKLVFTVEFDERGEDELV